MDSIGADQNVGGHLDRSRGRFKGRQLRPVGLRAHSYQPVTLVHGIAQAFAHGIQQEHLQPAAVHRQLWPFIARTGAPWFAPDVLAVAVVVRQSGRFHAEFLQPFGQAQLGEFAHRVRQQVQAHAQPSNLLRALIDVHVGQAGGV